MKGLYVWGVGALMTLTACTVPGLKELDPGSSIEVDVSFDFRAGCIAVVSRDKADPGKSQRQTFSVLGHDPAARQVKVSVRGADDGGQTLEIISTAHEHSCEGTEVARDTQEASLERVGAQKLTVHLSAVDADGDGYVPAAGGGTDCDDGNAEVTAYSFYKDEDGDGYGAGTPVRGCVAALQYVERGDDCDDRSLERAPGRAEVCDGVDNNCVDGIDEGLPLRSFYLDADDDGVGAGPALSACSAPAAYVSDIGDCDDGDAARKPGLAEICDDKDNDCNTVVDDGLDVETYYRDADADGYGNPVDSRQKCNQPAGYVVSKADCNDTLASVNPGAVEVCNDVDDNCVAGMDEGFNKTWYRDADEDGYGTGTAVTACTAPAGHVAASGDCNDDASPVRPGAMEVCNDVDDNCAGGIDEGLIVSTYYRDADADGYGNPADSRQKCNPPAGYVASNADCNDTLASVNPGATEACNDVDDNCRGGTDESFNKTWYRDADEDGYGAGTAVTACAAPAGHVAVSGDCNDNVSSVKPGATETCNDVDDNCAGGIDEGLSVSTYYRDADSDGYGNPADSRQKCNQPAGYVANNTDCNDALASVRPGATEVCNDVDDNCAGGADEGLPVSTYHRDADADGYGNPASSQQKCSRPSGYVSNNTDCNDALASVNPGATEVCNDVDDNCRGGTDEGFNKTWYRDADADGYGAGAAVTSCAAPAGHVAASGDCNDNASTVRPGATEVCNDVDDNCAGGIDEGVPVSTYYRDADADGYGNAVDSRQKCNQPAGYVANSTDCNDTRASVNPGATEVCNEVDDNCRSGIDEGFNKTWYRDADSDGYGTGTAVTSCTAPAGHVAASGDCNDALASVRPGAPEVCNDVDDNCAGGADEGLPVSTYYRDADADGYGNAASTRQKCNQPAGYVTSSTDCNDALASVNPGATEACNDVDDNCRNGTDEGFNKAWYRDSDADGYGTGTAVTSCTAPAGHVATSGDCNDSSSAVRPGAAEKCNNLDDNCDGRTDEPWPDKGDLCVGPFSCEGVYRCNPSGTGLMCGPPTEPVDLDGDGARGNGHHQNAWCLAETPPPSIAASQDDCDDADVHNAPGGVEVCDDRDNDCGNDVDEGGVCGGAGWKELTDPAVLGRDWYAVAVSHGSPSGYPVWLAGEHDALARRAGPNEPFISFDGECSAGVRWTAAWVRPSDGHVFLAGSNGFLAEHTGESCTVTRLWGESSDAMSIQGFEAETRLTIAVGTGIFSWSPGQAPVKVGTALPGIQGSRLLPDTEEARGFTPRAVAATDSASVYVTDPEGAIRRHVGVAGTPTSNWVTHFRSSGVLLDIDLSSPSNVWAVGLDGRVVHFPER